MKVVIIQLNSNDNKDQNLRMLENLISEACEHHQPNLIALPEMFNFMGNASTMKETAENIENGPSVLLLKKLARAHRVFVHGGSICEKENDKYFNTTPV